MLKVVILQCYVMAILLFLLRRCPGLITGLGFGVMYMIIVSIIFHIINNQ